MAKPSAPTPVVEPAENDAAMPDAQESAAPTSNPSQPPEPLSEPSPDAPIPTQPDAMVPGPRAQQLLTLHARALTATLRNISPSTFSACFPTIAASAPDVLASIHSQFISRLQTFAEADLKEILRERKVVENLNGLEELILDAKRRKSNEEKGGGTGGGAESNNVDDAKPLPGHLQPPEKLLEAHLSGTLESARSKLNAREQTLQSTNAKLFESVQAQYKEIEELTRGLESLVSDLEGAGEMIQDV